MRATYERGTKKERDRERERERGVISHWPLSDYGTYADRVARGSRRRVRGKEGEREREDSRERGEEGENAKKKLSLALSLSLSRLPRRLSTATNRYHATVAASVVPLSRPLLDARYTRARPLAARR